MRRTVSRRSFLSQVAGAGALALLPLSASRAQPTQRLEVDQDPSDPGRPVTTPQSTSSGQGGTTSPATNRRRTGITDTDRGSAADPPEYGRGRRRRSRPRITDSDPYDPVGSGRPGGPVTDSDTGANADAAGSGGPRSRFISCPGHPRCPR